MTTVEIKGEKLRKAVKWISSKRQEEKKALQTLIQEAGARFNLSPKDEEFLKSFFDGCEK